MRHADGGTGPGWNVQAAVDAKSGAVAADGALGGLGDGASQAGGTFFRAVEEPGRGAGWLGANFVGGQLRLAKQPDRQKVFLQSLPPERINFRNVFGRFACDIARVCVFQGGPRVWLTGLIVGRRLHVGPEAGGQERHIPQNLRPRPGK